MTAVSQRGGRTLLLQFLGKKEVLGKKEFLSKKEHTHR